MIRVAFEQFSVNYSPNNVNIIYELCIEKGQNKQAKTYMIEGKGEWQSLELFRHILENKGLDTSLIANDNV